MRCRLFDGTLLCFLLHKHSTRAISLAQVNEVHHITHPVIFVAVLLLTARVCIHFSLPLPSV